MFHRIGRLVVRHPVWTIVAWIVAGVAIVLTAPNLPSNSDESSFLPKSYQSIQAMELQKSAFPQAFTPSAIALFSRADGGRLTAADKAEAGRVIEEVAAKHLPEVQKVIPGPPSKDGRYGLGLVEMDSRYTGQPKQADATKALRAEVKKLVSGTPLQVRLGGSAAQALDEQESSKSGNAIVGGGVFVIILVTLLLIFRAPIIAFLPIIAILGISFVADGLIADATKLFNLQANNSVTTILIIVLFGVGTDYFLFLMFRYRERLRAGDESKEAMINAVGRVGEAIASAAGTVIIAFLALSLSSLGFFKQMGPALAIAVAVTLVAGLTLIPAICSLIPPRALFWPSRAWLKEPENARFAALGRMVQRRPAMVAAVSGLAMVALALGALGFKSNFDLASSSMPKTAESMVVQTDMQRAYSAGAAEPTSVYLSSTTGAPLDKSQLPGYVQKFAALPSVAGARLGAVNASGNTADITLTLKYDAASNQAIDAVGAIRDVARADAPAGTKALVGGQSAIFRDINSATAHDYRTVFPLAAVLIMVILGLVLRSLVAPWFLMASVALGFGATLGATVLLLQKTSDTNGLMFMLPVIMYLFVVAIGTDYNILMIARLREEAREGRPPREAAREALRHGGPTVAAAGFILAATFLSMILAGQSFLTEIGFSVGFGIVVAAFVMAMFFTPSLTALIGHAAWWPGHGDRRGKQPETVELPAQSPGDEDEEGPRVAVFNRPRQ